MHFRSTSEEETKRWAVELVRAHFKAEAKPLVVTLQGEMGAGKTQFAKGIAGALGVAGVVASPTYVLTREYQGEYGKLIHIDCWRVPQISAEELNLVDYFVPGNIVVIEWPEPLLPFLKNQKHLELLSFELVDDGEDARLIKKIS